VDFEIRAKNRPEGWAVEPRLTFVGLDRHHTDVGWATVEVDDPGILIDNKVVVLNPKPRGRLLSVTVRATSSADLPIPAEESAIDIRVARADIAPSFRSTGTEPIS